MEAATMKKYNTFGVVLVELHRQAASNFILSIVGAGYKMLKPLVTWISLPTKQILPPYLAPHLVIKRIVRMFYSSFVLLILLVDGKIISSDRSSLRHHDLRYI